MAFEQLIQDLKYDDLRWLLPVVAGLLIIVGGLLIGFVRGISAGLIVALFMGSLMSMSPALHLALEGNAGRGGPSAYLGSEASATVAELALANSDAATELGRAVASIRTALGALSPFVDDVGTVPLDPDLSDRFSQSLTDADDRLDAAINTLSRAAALRERLAEQLPDPDPELRPITGVR